MFFTWIDTLITLTVLGAMVAVAAHVKGYDWFPWFVYGFLVWPVALVHVLLRPHEGWKPSPPLPPPPVAPRREPQRRPCPFCAELILPDAKLCRFCNHDLPVAEAATTPAKPFDPAVVSSPASRFFEPAGATDDRPLSAGLVSRVNDVISSRGYSVRLQTDGTVRLQGPDVLLTASSFGRLETMLRGQFGIELSEVAKNPTNSN